MKALSLIMILVFFLYHIQAKKSAICYLISAFDSGVSGYIFLYQDTEDSKVYFRTEIYGTDQIEDFNFYKQNDFDDSCSNFDSAEVKYAPLFYNRTDLYSPSESILTEGELPLASLFEDNFYENYCYVGYKRSRKNRLIGIKDEVSYKIGGCGKVQHYDDYVGTTSGIVISIIGLISIVIYFAINKI